MDAHHFADRVGEVGDLLQAERDLFDALGREPQAVDCRVGEAVAGRRRQVERVRLFDWRAAFAQQLGRPAQPVVLDAGRGRTARRTDARLARSGNIRAVPVEIELRRPRPWISP